MSQYRGLAGPLPRPVLSRQHRTLVAAGLQGIASSSQSIIRRRSPRRHRVQSDARTAVRLASMGDPRASLLGRPGHTRTYGRKPSTGRPGPPVVSAGADAVSGGGLGSGVGAPRTRPPLSRPPDTRTSPTLGNSEAEAVDSGNVPTVPRAVSPGLDLTAVGDTTQWLRPPPYASVELRQSIWRLGQRIRAGGAPARCWVRWAPRVRRRSATRAPCP